jgi:hypothetical protein
VFDPATQAQAEQAAELKKVEAAEMRADKWEAFHAAHSSARFFKERRYLPLAFPELTMAQHALHIVELGCGAGASIQPLLKVGLLFVRVAVV